MFLCKTTKKNGSVSYERSGWIRYDMIDIQATFIVLKSVFPSLLQIKAI